MAEKRLLLEVLTEGHSDLLLRAQTIVDEWFSENEST